MALPAPEVQPLNQVLQKFTKEGELYEKLEGGKLRCFSCGHRCVIPEGKCGICLVRYNKGGALYVPHGYVGALQLDPVEKKPFFHAYPGSLAMSFGMLGCDYHCGYCVQGETFIATSQGPQKAEDLFSHASIFQDREGTTIATLPGLEVYSHKGRLRRVRQLFRHRYEGSLLQMKPAYFPSLYLTPDHELLVKKERGIEFVRAGELKIGNQLAVPKQYSFSHEILLNSEELLTPFIKPIHHKREIPTSTIKAIMNYSDEGYSSKEIGFLIEKDPSHVRHMKSKIKRGLWQISSLNRKPGYIVRERAALRFAKEHGPGIPPTIPLDENLAELIGYYCAEGSVLSEPNRVHAAELIFSFGPTETSLVERTCCLIEKVFGLRANIVKHKTALCVSVTKASLAHFFLALCGTGAHTKKIPAKLFETHRPVVEAFLEAYLKGDGHQYPNGKNSITTTSPALAYGLCWLLLKTGRFPSIYERKQKKRGRILGRKVNQAPFLFVVVWLSDHSKRKWIEEDQEYYYIPLQSKKKRRFFGYLYNMEVEEDHSYLAQFVATHNCQNWYTSQSLRDPKATAEPRPITPKAFVKFAKDSGARIVTSTYNEPLITSEWAVEIFQEAKKEGLITSYVSNGNGTPEVLEYIRPWVDLYKVDLKGFDDKHYRELGGVLSAVLDTIGRLHQMGFWIEIVTLIVPGFNDSETELRGIAKFLAGISKDIPWHVTAFHKDYKMKDHENTSIDHLIRAYNIGKEEGLNFVYPGNRPSEVGTRENSYCPSCHELLIERFGFEVLSYHLKPGGCCPKCDLKIPGRWD